MKYFYLWNFSLGAAPDLEAIKASLAKDGSEVIQTGSGVCIGSMMTVDQLIALLKQLGMAGADSLVTIDPQKIASQPRDVQSFIAAG